MAKIGAYATTLKDIMTGKTTVKNAISVAKTNPKGILSSSSDKNKSVLGSSTSGIKNEGNSALNGGNGGNGSLPIAKLNDLRGSSAVSNNADAENKRNQIAGITSSWNDTDDSINDTEKELDSFGKVIKGGLSKARDAYLNSTKTKLDKTNTAISGNRELITKNQTKDLRTLADDVRKSVFNTNISLGAASGSSASEAAAKAISRAAAKNRAETLSGYGDQISEQNLNESNAMEEYTTQRDSIYEWEERNRNQLLEDYENEKETLKRLKSKVPDWKKEDIENLQDRNLSKLIGGLQSIFTEAKSRRDTLNTMLSDMYGQADEVMNSTVDIDAPAELNTPTFDAELDAVDTGEEDDSAEDFYNPNVKNKKRIGTDILGNAYEV